MSQESLLAWGWRIPFVASIILIAVGLWVRLSITETPAFQKAIDKQERVEVPVVELFRNHKRSLVLGTFVALATFVLFYIGSAYLLSYNVKILKLPFVEALEVQLLGSVLFGLFIPLAGKLAERFGRREVLILTTVLIGAFSFLLPGLMTGGESGIFVFVILAMALMGMTYGLIGTALAAPFPTKVRYTGSSITFNFAGIFGASLAPYIATWLQANYGMTYVGYYLGLSAVITLVCILLSGKEEV
jgi:MFS family permease